MFKEDSKILGPIGGFGKVIGAKSDDVDAFTNVTSVSVDGVAGSKIDIPFSTDFGQTNNVSAFAWANTSVSQVFGNVFGHYNTGPARRKWLLGFRLGTVEAEVSADGSSGPSVFKQYQSVALFDDGSYHHIGFTFASNVLKLYVDGIELVGAALTKTQDGTVNTLFANTTDPVQIGSILLGGVPGLAFDGLIDEPLWWDKALTGAEVTALFNSSVVFDYTTHSAAAVNLQERYRFDGDTLPTVIGDINSNNGTSAGGVSLSTTVP